MPLRFAIILMKTICSYSATKLESLSWEPQKKTAQTGTSDMCIISCLLTNIIKTYFNIFLIWLFSVDPGLLHMPTKFQCPRWNCYWLFLVVVATKPLSQAYQPKSWRNLPLPDGNFLPGFIVLQAVLIFLFWVIQYLTKMSTPLTSQQASQWSTKEV